MFCSKCGKTVQNDAAICPACGAALGDSRFGGAEDYTSVQFSIAPGQKVFEPVKPYTRTVYTDMEDAEQKDAPVDSRTTYRPEFAGSSAPEDVRRNMREQLEDIKRRKSGGSTEETAEETTEAASPVSDVEDVDVPLSQASQETLGEIEEDLSEKIEIDRDSLRARPITLSGHTGISRDVSEYIRKMEDESRGKKTGAKRRTPVYDDYAVDDRDAKNAVKTSAAGRGRTQVGSDDDEYEDEDDYSGESGFGISRIIKIAVAVIVAALLVFGVVKWIGYIRGNQSSAPIEGVTGSYYDAGLALVKTYTDESFINERRTMYEQDGMLKLNQQLTQDVEDVKALMPEEPAANDSQFEAALLKIQSNVGNSIIMEALAGNVVDSAKQAELDGYRTTVANSIAQLESARSAAELTAITNGETIDVVTETPVPTTPPVNYLTLQKGDENNNVRVMQNRLYDLGYLNDTRDGVFGSNTQTAVKLFQQTAGLTATGIADGETQSRLYAEDAPYAPGATTPSPEQLSATPVPIAEPEATAEAEPAAEEEAVEGGDEV